MFIETVENSSVRENSFIIFPFLFNNTSFSSAKVHGEVYLVQHYVINFVSGRWFSLGTPVFPTSKTDPHDITEILLKVALNPINQPNQPWSKHHIIFLIRECHLSGFEVIPC